MTSNFKKFSRLGGLNSASSLSEYTKIALFIIWMNEWTIERMNEWMNEWNIILQKVPNNNVNYVTHWKTYRKMQLTLCRLSQPNLQILSYIFDLCSVFSASKWEVGAMEILYRLHHWDTYLTYLTLQLPNLRELSWQRVDLVFSRRPFKSGMVSLFFYVLDFC